MVCCPDGSSLSHSCHLTLCICGKLFQILISARRSIADRGIFPVMHSLPGGTLFMGAARYVVV